MTEPNYPEHDDAVPSPVLPEGDTVVVPVTITPEPPTSPTSPKVWAATLATLAVSLIVAVLTAVVNDPATLQSILEAVPAWLRFIIVAALPTLVTFLAGYVKRDRTREIGQQALNALDSEEQPNAI